jgi:hypothetical protein
MTGPSSRIGHSWTAEEFLRAQILRNAGTPITEIARELGRTRDGVGARLRMGPSRRVVHPWTPEEIALCLELSAKGLPPRRIALRLPNHNAKTISTKIADLRRTKPRDYNEEGRLAAADREAMAWVASLPWRVDHSIGAAEWWPR